jgi:hypothetical protein
VGQILQFINILMTGTVLVALMAAAVAYGRLVQKVEDHHGRLERLEDRIFPLK